MTHCVPTITQMITYEYTNRNEGGREERIQRKQEKLKSFKNHHPNAIKTIGKINTQRMYPFAYKIVTKLSQSTYRKRYEYSAWKSLSENKERK